MSASSINLFLRALENDYQQRLHSDALAAGERLDVQIDVRAAGNVASKQATQISEALTRLDLRRRAAGNAEAAGLLAILVSPVRDDILGDLARSAAAAGVGWVLLNRDADYIAKLRDEFPKLPVFSVLADQTEIGRIQARQAARIAKARGGILYITGPRGTSSADRRREGFESTIDKNALSAVTLEADWTSEGARLVVERWLDQRAAGIEPPAVAVAQNDEMALGVRQALRDGAVRLEQAAIGNIPIAGCDGSPTFGQRLVREKRLRATVTIASAAGPAVAGVMALHAGGARPPAEVDLPVASFPPLEDL